MEKQTKTLLIIFVICFCLGGAIVGVGALAKLQHWSWAGSCLITGLALHIGSYLLGAILIIKAVKKK